MISIEGLSKVYDDGFKALDDVNLNIKKGEIFALLGPNGAGKTTMISIICGIVNASSGSVKIDGFDIEEQFRQARSLVGLVPQELTSDAFITVWETVTFTRGLFNKPPNPEYLEKILRSLSLWDKKDNQLRTLSGGMKRRVLIAKALSHEPQVLFLDEPTAGVDVELRKDMWAQIRQLQQSGVTIILTTHYIEEAEDMADRVGVISGGKIILVEDKNSLMQKMGSKQLSVELFEEVSSLPKEIEDFQVQVDGNQLVFSYDSKDTEAGVDTFLCALHDAGIKYKDVQTRQSSLEEIFVELVK